MNSLGDYLYYIGHIIVLVHVLHSFPRAVCNLLVSSCQTITKQFIGHTGGKYHWKYQKVWSKQRSSRTIGRDLCPAAPSVVKTPVVCHCSLVDNSWEISYLVVQMVLSNNSGSRLLMDSLGIGREAQDVPLRQCPLFTWWCPCLVALKVNCLYRPWMLVVKDCCSKFNWIRLSNVSTLYICLLKFSCKPHRKMQEQTCMYVCQHLVTPLSLCLALLPYFKYFLQICLENELKIQEIAYT